MEDPATSSSLTSTWASFNSWFTPTVFFILLNLMIATILFTSNLPTNNNHDKQEEQQQQKQNSQNDNNQNEFKFARSPSILNRLKSFNFYPQRPEQESYPETHYQLQTLEVAATQYVFNQPLHYEHFDLDTDPTHQVGQSEFETGVVETGFDSDPTHRQIHRDSDPEVSYQEDEEEEEEEEEETDQFESLDEVYSRLKGGNVDRSISEGDILPQPSVKKVKKSASMKVGFSHFGDEEIVEARRPETMRERKSAEADDGDDDDVEVDSKAADFINKFKNDLILQRIESIAARSK